MINNAQGSSMEEISLSAFAARHLVTYLALAFPTFIALSLFKATSKSGFLSAPIFADQFVIITLVNLLCPILSTILVAQSKKPAGKTYAKIALIEVSILLGVFLLLFLPVQIIGGVPNAVSKWATFLYGFGIFAGATYLSLRLKFR